MSQIVIGDWSNPNEQEYLEALCDVLDYGDVRRTRNGNTRAIFARQMRFLMSDGFPMLTTKTVPFKSVKAELKWFIEGGKNSPVPYRLSVGRLNELMDIPIEANNPLWSLNQQQFVAAGKAQFPGDCGVIYGSQWRNYNGEGVDQLQNVINLLKKDPFSRYHILVAWNPLKTSDMCLPPCHMKVQFFVRNSRRKDRKKYLSLHMDQRSCDMFLGVPFNIASYALLLHLVAQCVGMVADELVITLNDCHIYTPHLKAVRTQLSRSTLRAPKLWLDPSVTEIDGFEMDHIKLVGYENQGRIKAKLL